MRRWWGLVRSYLRESRLEAVGMQFGRVRHYESRFIRRVGGIFEVLGKGVESSLPAGKIGTLFIE